MIPKLLKKHHHARNWDRKMWNVSQSFRFLSLFLLDNFINVHDTLAFVNFWRLTTANSSSKLVHPLLVNPSAAHYVWFEAEHTYCGRYSKFYLMAVPQFQKQEATLRFSSRFEPHAYYLQKPKEFGLHSHSLLLPKQLTEINIIKKISTYCKK